MVISYISIAKVVENAKRISKGFAKSERIMPKTERGNNHWLMEEFILIT